MKENTRKSEWEESCGKAARSKHPDGNDNVCQNYVYFTIQKKKTTNILCQFNNIFYHNLYCSFFHSGLQYIQHRINSLNDRKCVAFSFDFDLFVDFLQINKSVSQWDSCHGCTNWNAFSLPTNFNYMYCIYS